MESESSAKKDPPLSNKEATMLLLFFLEFFIV